MIRPMRREDKEEFLAMMTEFYHTDATETEGSPEIFEQDFEYCLSDFPLLEGYMFEVDGKIAGYATVTRSYSVEYGKICIWLEDIYLKKEYRGQGLGTEYLEFVRKQYPGTISMLEVEPENRRACSVYEKNGFHFLAYSEMKRDN